MREKEGCGGSRSPASAENDWASYASSELATGGASFVMHQEGEVGDISSGGKEKKERDSR